MKKGTTKKVRTDINRGDIYYVNFEEGTGSEQCGRRPCIVIQNEKGNHYGSTTIIAMITKAKSSSHLPVHVPISRKESKLRHNSIILTEQIRTIDKRRLGKRVHRVSEDVMDEVSLALAVSVLSKTGDRVDHIEMIDKDNNVYIA